MTRAIVRFNKTYVSVLCPIGHVITSHKLDKELAGSWFEAELGRHAANQPNSFDRQAATCKGAGHAPSCERGLPMSECTGPWCECFAEAKPC